MSRIPKDREREKRIHDEAVVDAYGPEEQAMGWYYYLENQLTFPFWAICDRKRPISPLKDGQRVEVLKMGPEDECVREMFVFIRWESELLAVPLSQLKWAETEEDDEFSEESQEAIADWRYWTDRGYEFG